jgi:hypothetical protein
VPNGPQLAEKFPLHLIDPPAVRSGPLDERLDGLKLPLRLEKSLLLSEDHDWASCAARRSFYHHFVLPAEAKLFTPAPARSTTPCESTC